MNLRKTIYFLILFILLCDSTNAQEATSNTRLVSKLKVNKNLPTAYLSFEKFGEIRKKNSKIPVKVGFLSLHNNTILPIAVDANFDLRMVQPEKTMLSDGSTVDAIPDKATVDVCFDVDVIPFSVNKQTGGGIVMGVQSKDKNPAENDKTTCFWRNNWRGDEFGNGERLWIKSNQSFVFAVPVEYLKNNLKVSILFNYEWEFDGVRLNFEEPKHKVYFYGGDLPK